MDQKIITIGNSNGITLPKTVLEDLGVKPGETISVSKNYDQQTYTISKSGKNVAGSITPHFLKVLDRVNKTYGKALKELAGK